MKKLLIFALLFAFIFTKANLREGTIEKKNFGVIIKPAEESDLEATDVIIFKSKTFEMEKKDSINSVPNTSKPSLLKRILSWFGF